MCSSCIKQLFNKPRIKCPLCNTSTMFPPETTKNNVHSYLVGNFSLLEILLHNKEGKKEHLSENKFDMPTDEMCSQVSIYNGFLLPYVLQNLAPIPRNENRAQNSIENKGFCYYFRKILECILYGL